MFRDTIKGTYSLLTPWCRVHLEQLTCLQLVKKFPKFHGTRRFITVLTSVRQLSLSWASPIQSIYPHPSSWRSILILSTHLRLGLPSGLFPSGFPTKTLYTPLYSPIRATCPAHLILLDFITRTILSQIILYKSNISEKFIVYSYNKRQGDALFLKFILRKNSTCFGQICYPSSGLSILYTQHDKYLLLCIQREALDDGQ